MKIENIVAFLILMDSGTGIEGKSPDYIMEKYQRYVLSGNDDEFMYGLDDLNKWKLEKWRTKWDKDYKKLKSLRK